MRIAFVTGAFPTVSETFILNQITGLIDRGHEVDIYTARAGDGAVVHDDVQRYGLLARTRVPLPAAPTRAGRAMHAAGLLLSHAAKYPRSFVRLPRILGYDRTTAYTATRLRSSAGAAPVRYDIAHCHFGVNGLLGLALYDLGVLSGAMVTTFHGYDANTVSLTQGRRRYRALFRRCKGFTVSTDFMHDRLAALGCPARAIEKIPCGVRPASYPFRERQPVVDRPVRVLTVARLVEVKGVEYGLRAVAQMIAAGTRVRYDIVGDGVLRAQLEQLAQDLSIADHVHFHGALKAEDLIAKYDAADLFLLSGVIGSDGAQEGQGVVLLEAQACGLPCIASDVGGIPETVVGGESAILVPQRDVQRLCDAMTSLIGTPETWPRMSRAGRAHVETNYDLKKLNDRLVELYRGMIGGSVG